MKDRRTRVKQTMEHTHLDTAVLHVVVAVVRDPFGHEALAMVLPDSFSRHDVFR